MALERPDFHREGQRFDSVILHNIIQRLPGSVIYIDIKIKKEEIAEGAKQETVEWFDSMIFTN